MSTTARALYAVPDSVPLGHFGDETQKKRQKLVRAGRLHGAHWAVVGLSLLLTLTAWYIADRSAQKTVEERFHREADQVVALVKERMRLYESALWSAVALIDSNGGEIDYIRWLLYASSVRIDADYPGINGIGVIFNVKPADLDSFEARQSDWQPGFRVHPPHDKPEKWPITFIEPATANAAAVGLDIAFESNRYSALVKARDTGKAQVTGPIVLVQDARQTPGFLLYTPFYKKGGTPANVADRRANIVGVTYAPFIMSKLMEGTLASRNRHVSVEISDNAELLYQDDYAETSDNGPNHDIDPDPLYSKRIEVDMYGRKWSFQLNSDLGFRASADNNQPMFILLGGIVIDGMLLSLFIFLSRANRRALAYADDMTGALRDKTRLLEKSNADLEQFAYVASHDLKSPLNAIHKLIGWIEEDLGKEIPDASRKHLQLLKGRSRRMSKLLDDLLNYSRISRLDYEVETLSLKECAESIFALLDKPVNFAIDVRDLDLVVPRIPFELLLRNLISNSVKHHDRESGLIRVEAELNNGFYFIKVTDDGPGIPAELHAKVFEMFETLQSRDRVEGSGMGLALVKRVAEASGGDIAILESDGRATTMMVRWPVPNQINAGGQQTYDEVSNYAC